MSATAHGTTLANVLRECAEVCTRTLEACVAARATDLPYFSPLMLAAAGLERATDAQPDDAMYEVSLLIASTLAEEAVSVLRAAADDGLRDAAAAAERAAYACRAASMRSVASSSAASAGSPPRA
jgi:hypothetical protein